jgi:hypothetical protein
MSSTGAKGSQQTNKKTEKWFKYREQKTAEVCLGLAHRTVRCTTGQCPVHQGLQLRTAHLREFWEPLCYNSPDCPVCQRSNGYSSANGHLQQHLMRYSARRSQARARRHTGQSTGPVRCTTGLSGGPDVKSSNGRMTWLAHRTVSGGAPDCLVRHATATFSNDYNLVGGYKYHPNRPLQGGSPSNIPSHLVDILKPSQPHIFIDPSHAQDLGHYNQHKCHKKRASKRKPLVWV